MALLLGLHGRQNRALVREKRVAWQGITKEKGACETDGGQATGDYDESGLWSGWRIIRAWGVVLWRGELLPYPRE